LLPFGYPGGIATAGNLALLYPPSDISMGVYRFSAYHLVKVENPSCLFPVEIRETRGDEEWE